MTLSQRVLVAALLYAAVILGCSDGRPPGALPTKKAKVTVTYKGAPVSDATVSFINDAKAAFGKTDAQGVAKMWTYIEDDGAVVAKHQVTIIKNESTSSGSNVSQDSPDYVPPAGGGAPPPVVKHLIPQKYASPATSGLTADVTDAGPNEFTFDLKD